VTGTIVIRRATIADAAVVSRFAARVFEHTFGPDNSAEDMAQYLAQAFTVQKQSEEIGAADNVCLLAELEGAIVGYALLTEGSTHETVVAHAPTATRFMEICRFYVDPEWHGRGIAHTLMDACVAKAQTTHAEQLWLGVWSENPKAIRFYEKRGFAQVGVTTFMLGSDLQHDKVMALALA
jgi:ribosomal protein S18 acetylase RimI-like enzyme